MSRISQDKCKCGILNVNCSIFTSEGTEDSSKVDPETVLCVVEDRDVPNELKTGVVMAVVTIELEIGINFDDAMVEKVVCVFVSGTVIGHVDTSVVIGRNAIHKTKIKKRIDIYFSYWSN